MNQNDTPYIHPPIVFFDVLKRTSETVDVIHPLAAQTLGLAFKERRASRNIPISRAARDLKISRSSYVRIENGDEQTRYTPLVLTLGYYRYAFYVEGLPMPCPSIIAVMQLILKTRIAQNLSLRELAERSNCSHVLLFEIERAVKNKAIVSCGFKKIISILAALGIRSCIIRRDDHPRIYHEVILEAHKKNVKHPMHKSPYETGIIPAKTNGDIPMPAISQHPI